MPNRKPKISAVVKSLIASEALGDLKKPRQILAQELQEKIAKLNVRSIPEEETLMRMISKIRNRKSNPQDAPWSLATIEQYPLTPEVLPSVLKAWIYHEEHYWEEVSEEKEPGMEFSIRDAKWVARLYCVTEDIELLTIMAKNYAFLEKIAEALDCEFDSTELDFTVYGCITGENITGKRREKILLNSSRHIESETLEDLAFTLKQLSPHEKSMILGSVIKPKIKEQQRKEEVRNERVNSFKREE